MGGENLSRFIDGELSASSQLEVSDHVGDCPSCARRLAQFRLADHLLSRVRGQRPRAGRLVASVSVAAALVASLATNVALSPAKPVSPPPASFRPLAAPSEALTSFYEKVAPRVSTEGLK